MTFFIAIIYSVLILSSLFVVSLKKNNSRFGILSPLFIFLLYVALEIPYLIKVSINMGESLPVYAKINIVNFEMVYILHVVNSMIYAIFVALAIVFFIPNEKSVIKYGVFESTRPRGYLNAHILLLIFGVGFYLFFMQAVGGVGYLLVNLDSKSSIIAGTGYLQGLYGVAFSLSIGYLIFYYAKIERITVKHKAYLLIVLALVFVLLALIGSRKSPLLLLLYSLVMWHLCIAKINLFRAKFVFALSLALIYFAAIPELRVAGASEYYAENPLELISKGFDNIFNFFDRFSHLNISLLVYSLFDFNSLWWGASFKDLLYAPVPRSIYPDKPPVDEGVYIYNLAHGYLVSPPTPLTEMMAVGWPHSTITNMYANFWIVGVALGGFFTGIVYKILYNSCSITKADPFFVLLYCGVIFGDFALTNIKIVNFLTLVVFSLFYMLVLRVLIKRV